MCVYFVGGWWWWWCNSIMVYFNNVKLHASCAWQEHAQRRRVVCMCIKDFVFTCNLGQWECGCVFESEWEERFSFMHFCIYFYRFSFPSSLLRQYNNILLTFSTITPLHPHTHRICDEFSIENNQVQIYIHIHSSSTSKKKELK